MRDAPVASALDRVVGRVLATGQPVAHLFSGQMGIVMYTLANQRFGHVDITDRHGLTDRRLSTCSLAATRPRMPNGLAIEYGWYLPRRKKLEQECGVPQPDILYDIEPVRSLGRAKAANKYGYALVYHQVCDVPQPDGLIRGYNVALDEFIAVRKELIPRMGLHELPVSKLADAAL